MGRRPPHQWAPPGTPPPSLPPPPPTDPLQEIWRAIRTLLHAVSLFAIFLLMSIVIVDLMVLVWSWWPVSEATLRFDSASALFIIAPSPGGGAAMSGIQALVLGALLIVMGGVMYAIKRTGNLPGLGGAGTMFMAVLTAISGAGTALLGVYLAAQGNMFDPATVPNVLPTPMALMILRFTLLAQWHSIMMGAILMSAAALFIIEGPPLVRMARKSMAAGLLPPIRTDNALIMIFRMYMAILGFYIVYYVILGAFTVEPEVPAFAEMPLWEQLHAFAEASVWEEILSRVLLLGIPLMVYHLWTRQGKPSWRYVVGGGFSIDTAAFVLIVLQALVFALAHVAGWDLWKVLPTMISGMAFGYLFLKRGLWASIILHFTFDYLGMTVPVLAEWGLDVKEAFGMAYIFIGLVGIVLMVHFVVIIIGEGGDRLREALTERPVTSSKAPDGKA